MTAARAANDRGQALEGAADQGPLKRCWLMKFSLGL
jgi:hypothetical protein